MNRVALVGLLIEKPVVAMAKSGNPYLRFSLAIRDPYLNKKGEARESTDFVPCLAFGQLAGLIAKNLDKGSFLAVNGRIKSGSYLGQDGKRRKTLVVMVSEAFWPSGRAAEKIEFGAAPPLDLDRADADIPF